MKMIELYPVGSFESWEPEKLKELRESSIETSFTGGTLLFENEYIKLWELTLSPGERLPFSKKNTNYTWTCISGGHTVTHNGDGSIRCYVINEGDTHFFKFKNKNNISDVKNSGKNIIVIHIVEYKHEIYDFQEEGYEE